MSNTSIKSCGPINCQLTRAKKYIQSGVPASYCKLTNCNENFSIEISSKSPGELIEYCQPANCATFWDAYSDNFTTTPKKSLKEDVAKHYLDDQNTLFNHPRCDNYECPKQAKESSKSRETSDQNTVQVNLCGPPNCCTTSNVDGKLKAPKNRNPVYYCVSPSVYADLSKYELSANKEKVNSDQNDLNCPHVKCCELQSKSKDNSDSAYNRVKKSDSNSFGKKIAGAVKKSVHQLNSKHEQNVVNNESRIPSNIFLKELSKYARKSVNYARNESVVTQSSLKLINLQKKEPPKQQVVINKVSSTNDYVKLSDILQKNSDQDKENVQTHVEEVKDCKNYKENSDCQDSTTCCPSNCKKKQPVVEKVPKEPCQPNTCEKLLGIVGSKKWKSCCDSKTCPINDPTSSTYNFLLRVRMCCKTKQCQLAAKICDIYEPLVEVKADLSDIGDPQYHYLAYDSSTMVSYNDFNQVIEYECKTIESASSAEQSFKDTTENEVNEPSVAEEKESYSVLSHKEDDSQNTRRVSTVSWGVPNFEGSQSQEQLITQATAEADKFRQTIDVLQRGSIFGEVVRHTTLSSLPTSDNEGETPVSKSFDKCKSQLSSVVQNNDKKPKQKWYSCAALRNKFRRKKKSIPEESTQCTWNSSEYQEKRKTINISLEPIQGRNQEINHVLHEI